MVTTHALPYRACARAFSAFSSALGGLAFATWLLLAAPGELRGGVPASPLVFKDSRQPLELRVDDLLARLSLDEKAGLMKNASVGVPRLDIPSFEWWNEGLHGVARAGVATVFPQAIGLAATWDSALLGEVASVVSTEARAKYAEAARNGHAGERYRGLSLWSPNINIFRDPRWGRGQETYGEDPVLTGTMGSAFVRGLQGPDPLHLKTAAAAKHLAAHSGPEATRYKVNVEPPAADFHETYLPAFRQLVTEARVEGIMTAYNAVYGEPASASPRLFGLLRDWGFNGHIVSDCGAVYCLYEKYAIAADFPEAEALAVKAGLSLRCGSGDAQLAIAVRRGLLTEQVLDSRLRPLLRTLFKLGVFDSIPANPYAAIKAEDCNTPAHSALALEAARKSLVLLKNNGILPLDTRKPLTVAVVGPNADSVDALLGNYHGTPAEPVTVLEGLRRLFPAGTRFLHARGSDYASLKPGASPIPRTSLTSICDCEPAAEGDSSGLIGEYFANDALLGKPAAILRNHQIDFDWDGKNPAPGLSGGSFSVRWSGKLQPGLPGDFLMNFDATGGLRVFIGDNCVVDTWEGNPEQATHEQFRQHFNDANPVAFRIEYRHRPASGAASVSARWTPPAEDSGYEQALEFARKADLIIFVSGITAQLEGEDMRVDYEGFDGGDRTRIELPDTQARLVTLLASTGHPLVLVNLSGSAMAFGAAGRSADAILQAWYPGQSGGLAIAETLLGRNNPGACLPVTFYRATRDLPDFASYSMEGRSYRYFRGEPEFPFGHGLSYTSFSYGKAGATTQDSTATVSLEVSNTGKLAGDHVVQLYLREPEGANSRAKRTLAAFVRVSLMAGETKTVSLRIPSASFERYAPSLGRLDRLKGSWTIELGASSNDLRTQLPLSVN